MVSATAVLAGAGIGFAVGSVPFAWIVHRIRTGGDLRTAGSGNPGATNLYRLSGSSWGALGLAFDAGKGAAAVTLGGLAAGEAGGLAAAVGVVSGHVASPWLGFRGGKGVAPAAGAFAMLAPWATLAAAGVFAAGVAVSGWVSLGSVLAAAALPPLILAVGPAWPEASAASIVTAIVAWRHRENFARMRDGTEPRARGGVAPGEGERR